MPKKKKVVVEESEPETEEEVIEEEPEPKYRRTIFEHWSDSFIEMDMFGAAPQLEIRGKKKVKSICGALVSLLSYILIVIYLGFKLLYYMQDIGIIKLFL
jgi:hypothetical protein